MSTINNDVWHDLLENKARYVHAHVSTVASKTRIASNFLLGHSSRIRGRRNPLGDKINRPISRIHPLYTFPFALPIRGYI